MLEWCLSHPYLTVLTVITVAYILDNIVANICRIIEYGRLKKLANKFKER